MKKRYSNFHRARKYYRKFWQSTLSPTSEGMKRSLKIQTLYKKYADRAEERDNIVIGHKRVGFNPSLFVETRYSPTSKLVEDWGKSITLEEEDLPSHTDISDYLTGKYHVTSPGEGIMLFSR